MKKTIVHMGLILVVAGSMIFLNGCGSSQKTTPHMWFSDVSIETQLDREDVVVLDTVRGDSTITSVLFGLIQIVDEDKLQLFGIKFFKDKYTYFQGYSGMWRSVADRAYYKALEAHPDADAVLIKSMDHEDEGIPLIYYTKSITYKGKAIKLKADQ
jgi:hypothetical protein